MANAYAHTNLRDHDAALADLPGAGLNGTLRFGCPDDDAAAILPHILRRFAGRHPQVFVEVACAPTPRLLARVRQHALDLQVLPTGTGLPALPTVALAVQFGLPRPPALVLEFAEHLRSVVPTL